VIAVAESLVVARRRQGDDGLAKVAAERMVRELAPAARVPYSILRPADVYGPRDERLLKLFELWDRRDALVKTFSGGMKRRLEIARGFLHTPKILFLDEPTLGLDPQTRNQLWTQVKALNAQEGVTVFLTTHYMEEAERVAQRIAIIDHGKIAAQGTATELKQQTGTDSLEQAFLNLTGTSIRSESATSADAMRAMAAMWQRGRR